MSQINTKTPIIVALDYADQAAALAFADTIDPRLCRLKVGKEMFTRFGPSLVQSLQDRGFDIFLDLKFHDIPNTVARSVQAAADLGVWMLNVHALGGDKMLAAAREALTDGNYRSLLIGVTVLTSMDRKQLASIGYDCAPESLVMRLATLCEKHALDGVVCSAQEAKDLRFNISPEFKLVTPGIRLETNQKDDQVRTMTPVQALGQGVDYLVIGRPITQAKDPLDTLNQIINSFS